MKAEDESTQTRNCKNDNDDEAKRMEDMRSKRMKDDSSIASLMEIFPLCMKRNLRDSKGSQQQRKKKVRRKRKQKQHAK